jgi:hypothetical protein
MSAVSYLHVSHNACACAGQSIGTLVRLGKPSTRRCTHTQLSDTPNILPIVLMVAPESHCSRSTSMRSGVHPFPRCGGRALRPSRLRTAGTLWTLMPRMEAITTDFSPAVHMQRKCAASCADRRCANGSPPSAQLVVAAIFSLMQPAQPIVLG